MTVNATEAGYAYIFISNENPTFVDAYFDDLSVTHTLSPIVATSDYFPYGLTYNDMQRSNSWEQKYLYSGKELQDELALNWYDFGARMYMPEIGRWGVIDPLAEQSRRWTPYRYGFDNPMRFIDPDGMSEVEGVNYSDGYSTQNTKTTTGSIELWQLSADAQQKVNTIRGIRDALLRFIKNSSTTTDNNSYYSGGDDKTEAEAGVSGQQESFNVLHGILTINGVVVAGAEYDGKTSMGSLWEILTSDSEKVRDIRNNSLINPRPGNGLTALRNRLGGENGIRIPNSLVRWLKGNDFRDALGPHTDEFWFRFQQGKGSIFYQSTNDGMYGGQVYSVSEYRFIASYSIFTGKNNPPIQIGIKFHISVYSPIVPQPATNFTNTYINSFGQH